jgi:hypothetical protein
MDGNMVNHLNQPGNRKFKWKALVLVLVLILVGIAVAFGKHYMEKRAVTSEYQAVFLTNGQVYFGKVDFSHGWVVLNDIFYLQKTEDLQSADSGDANTPTEGTQTPPADSSQERIQLVKLGSELHGPQDKMYVSRQEVLFWENMKDDSKVVQSIKQFKGQ